MKHKPLLPSTVLLERADDLALGGARKMRRARQGWERTSWRNDRLSCWTRLRDANPSWSNTWVQISPGSWGGCKGASVEVESIVWRAGKGVKMARVMGGRLSVELKAKGTVSHGWRVHRPHQHITGRSPSAQRPRDLVQQKSMSKVSLIHSLSVCFTDWRRFPFDREAL